MSNIPEVEKGFGQMRYDDRKRGKNRKLYPGF